MTAGDNAPPGDDPALGAELTMLNMRDVRVRVILAARAVAATEERLAATLARLATNRPDRARHLRAMSEAARTNAACNRQWADDHSHLLAGGPLKDGGTVSP